MALYLQILSVTLAEYFAYRLNFILWRLRSFFGLVIRYYLWLAVYEHMSSIFGYSESQMLTYVLLSTIISGFVLSTRTPDIAGQTLNGDIINFLLKPFSFFGYFLTRDIVDKILNLIFSVVEILILYALLKPQLFISSNPSTWFFVVALALLGNIIAFNINVLISFIAFWSPEVWAPRFIFFILVMFFSGGFFPLDILPPFIYKLLLLTPFPYFYFIPTKIYLGHTHIELVAYTVATLVWTVLSSYIVLRVWKKGLRGYSFYGR